MSTEPCSDAGLGVELLPPMTGGWSPGSGRHIEENADPTDGWRDLMFSPKVQFTGFVSDPGFVKQAPQFFSGVENVVEKGGDNSLPTSEKHDSAESGSDNSLVLRNGGRIAERRAAKCGFDASKINCSQFITTGPMVSSSVQSPIFLRTPGISPGALLESPMMLPNLQPSPTTGAFSFPNVNPDDQLIQSASSTKFDDKGCDDSSFTFKPHGGCYPSSQSLGFPSSNLTQAMNIDVDSSNHASAEPQPMAFEFPAQLITGHAATKNSDMGSPADSEVSADLPSDKMSEFQRGHFYANTTVGMQQQSNGSTQGGEEMVSNGSLDEEQRVVNPSVGNVVSEDEYNWRKYGQKQVRGSEFPRSYYKCTHPSCPVKKKVEHSYDGNITEIIYKGAHNHSKPQLNRRSSPGSALTGGERIEISVSGETCIKTVGGLPNECNFINAGPDSRSVGLERTSSASFATEVSGDPPTATETVGTSEISSMHASNEEAEEDEPAHGSLLLVENDDNEHDLKRRKVEIPLIETSLGSRAVREPRVIVQIESDIDILDDGYRWRKYGQKVVKGNPNPRSYYKCTYPGCTVRKHVERASHNLKCVLTTYEGKHNHDVPTSRNSSHSGSGGAGNSGSSLINSQAGFTIPRNSQLPKSEPQDFGVHSNRKFANKEYVHPNYLGDYGSGGSSVHQMKLPTLPNPMFYGNFGLNPNNYQANQAPIAQAIPGLSAPGPLGYHHPPNLAVNSFENQGRPMASAQNIFSKDGDVRVLGQIHD